MATNSFYRTPHLTTVSFAVGILLFLLPFVEIKCNGTTLAQLKGLDMVTGATPKSEEGELDNQFERMTKTFDSKDNAEAKKTTNEKDGKSYIAAIVALALGVIGLIISFIKKGVFNKTEMIAGIIGAIALIILMIQVKGDVSERMKDENKGFDTMTGAMGISIDFTIWFYLCVLSYLSAAFFSFKQKQLVVEHEVPSSNAPQVHINNPGDQSDFPPAATGEKDLG